MGAPLDDAALDVIFRRACAQNKWLDRPVANDQLVALYDLLRWGPTSANCFPVRIVFVTSQETKTAPRGARLRRQPAEKR